MGVSLRTSNWAIEWARCACVIVVCCWIAVAGAAELQVHYINVGQGGSTLIIGPDGTTILYDFGKVAGRHNIVPYLRDIAKVKPEDGIHFAIVSHGDIDHYAGYRDVIAAGYDVLIANFKPGTDKAVTPSMRANWLDPAKKTRAGAFKAIPVGFRIPLGDGAEAFVIAANGIALGEATGPSNEPRARRRPLRRMNENDRSISLFVRYRNFHYLLDGDLGSGSERCTDHQTNQVDVQTRAARALINFGLMTAARGVDVLHIAHHGSESSTSAEYYRLTKPEVGLISVGPNQGTFLHPRVDVVEKILTCRTGDGRFREDACEVEDTRAPCVRDTKPLKALFQTDNGSKGCSSTGCTSFMGLVGGDLLLKTDGKDTYTITVSGRISSDPNMANVLKAGTTFQFTMDEHH